MHALIPIVAILVGVAITLLTTFQIWQQRSSKSTTTSPTNGVGAELKGLLNIDPRKQDPTPLIPDVTSLIQSKINREQAALAEAAAIRKELDDLGKSLLNRNPKPVVPAVNVAPAAPAPATEPKA